VREAVTGRGVVRQSVLTRAILGVSACALTALVYIPFVDNPFVLDDRTTVLLNPSLVDPVGARGILLYDPWHPLVTATFAIDRALSGVSPLGFHITNGILHLIVVALIFVLTTRGQPRVRLGSDQGQTTCDGTSYIGQAWTGFVAAAAFGVNPLTARTVAYVSARGHLLFAAGVLLAATLAWGAARARSAARFALAAGVAVLALAAMPLGLPATHGPRRFYLVIAAALLAAARWAPPQLARSRPARVAGVFAIAVLAFLTHRTLTLWADPVALWRAQVERTPAAWDAHLGYADALREASHCAEAVPEYETALRMNPGQPDAQLGLSACARR
jgi:hypothetical protein